MVRTRKAAKVSSHSEVADAFVALGVEDATAGRDASAMDADMIEENPHELVFNEEPRVEKETYDFPFDPVDSSDDDIHSDDDTVDEGEYDEDGYPKPKEIMPVDITTFGTFRTQCIGMQVLETGHIVGRCSRMVNGNLFCDNHHRHFMKGWLLSIKGKLKRIDGQVIRERSSKRPGVVPFFSGAEYKYYTESMKEAGSNTEVVSQASAVVHGILKEKVEKFLAPLQENNNTKAMGIINRHNGRRHRSN